jgi:exopolysaccharide biosynthesis WecB/TagA/CpsF family protein
MARSTFADDHGVDTAIVGGLTIACLNLQQTADLMIAAVEQARARSRPYYMTSANGEVIARRLLDNTTAELFEGADLVSADGQPMVVASRFFCKKRLPERVATTDLFDLVAKRAERHGVSFYFLGGDADVNYAAVEAVRNKYPKLRILGASHGFLDPIRTERVIDEISRLAPDILWIGMGVPREQAFALRWIDRLATVGVIKTTGGLFDFVAQRVPRAPGWMQASSLEWAWRLSREPKRLFWRYAITNPLAIYAMITRSG